jgi:hypothetical protein
VHMKDSTTLLRCLIRNTQALWRPSVLFCDGKFAMAKKQMRGCKSFGLKQSSVCKTEDCIELGFGEACL